MAGRHHVLLIGIDAYDGGGTLTGCVNDIDAVQRLLIDRVGVAPGCITRLAAPRAGIAHEADVLGRTALPTLAELRGAFDRLGTGEVGPEDRVLVYYSGHGTQLVLADRNGRRFSREALLPKDKVRGADRRFLFDWELNVMISRVAERAAAVTVVLDCCSAAGATRAAFDGVGGQDRFLPTPADVRLWGDEAVPGDTLRGVTAIARVPGCLLVAACRDDERARESAGADGRVHGELTRGLVQCLAGLSRSELADLRWGQIWRAVAAEVRRANPRQSPWLSGSLGRRLFGFGGDEEADPGYAVTASGSLYRLDAGTLAGVTEDAEVAVYGPTPSALPALGTAEDLAARKGRLRVRRAGRSSSEAEAVATFDLPAGARGRLSKAGRAARLRVALEPYDGDVAANLAGSPFVEVVSGPAADLTLARRSADGGWALTDDVHGTGETGGQPVLAVIPAGRRAAARAVVEHYHAYAAPLRMARACHDLPVLLRLWLLDCNGRAVTAEEAQAPDLPQVPAGGAAPYQLVNGDRVCVVVENAGEVDLSVTLIDCTASGRVLILGEKRVPGRTQHVFWASDTLGQPFVARLPSSVSLGVDRIAAIATPRPDVSLRFLERRGTFADLLRPDRGGRDLGDAAADDRPPADRWTAVLTAVRISRFSDA